MKTGSMKKLLAMLFATVLVVCNVVLVSADAPEGQPEGVNPSTTTASDEVVETSSGGEISSTVAEESSSKTNIPDSGTSGEEPSGGSEGSSLAESEASSSSTAGGEASSSSSSAASSSSLSSVPKVFRTLGAPGVTTMNGLTSSGVQGVEDRGSQKVFYVPDLAYFVGGVLLMPGNSFNGSFQIENDTTTTYKVVGYGIEPTTLSVSNVKRLVGPKSIAYNLLQEMGTAPATGSAEYVNHDYAVNFEAYSTDGISLSQAIKNRYSVTDLTQIPLDTIKSDIFNGAIATSLVETDPEMIALANYYLKNYIVHFALDTTLVPGSNNYASNYNTYPGADYLAGSGTGADNVAAMMNTIVENINASVGEMVPGESYTFPNVTAYFHGGNTTNPYNGVRFNQPYRIYFVLEDQAASSSSSKPASSSSVPPAPVSSSSSTYTPPPVPVSSSSSRLTSRSVSSSSGSASPASSGSVPPVVSVSAPSAPSASVSFNPENPPPPSGIIVSGEEGDVSRPGITDAFGNGGPPLLGPAGASWSLLNLICALLGLFISVVLAIGLFGKRKEQKAAEGEDEIQNKQMPEEKVYKKKSSLLVKVLTMAFGLLTGILFLIFEDMRLPMAWLTQWSYVIVPVFLVSLVCLVIYNLSKRRAEIDDQDDEVPQGS